MGTPLHEVRMGGVSYTDVRGRLDTRQFIVSCIMSELDLLLYKTNVYAALAQKTRDKRVQLAERVETQAKGIKSFPDIIAKAAQADPTQLSDANAILTEESMYVLLRRRISARYNVLVRDMSAITDLRKTRQFTAAEMSQFEAALQPHIVARRQRELTEAVDRVESILQGDSRRDIREHLYGTLVSFANNPRTMVDTLRFNYLIMGPPGTGKSYLAHAMSDYFSVIGLFVRKDMSNVKKPDLVASYVGQSAGKTRRAVYSSLEGIFFLDEAYSLLSCEYVPGTANPRQVTRRDQYGLEAIDQLVDMMTELKGLVCIMVVGYEEEMQTCFMGTNPGLQRRFAQRWTLQRYSRNELLAILSDMLRLRDEMASLVFSQARRVFGPGTGFTLTDAVNAMGPFMTTLDYMNALPNQAGDVETLAGRLYEMYTIAGGGRNVTDRDLEVLSSQFLAENIGGKARIHEVNRQQGIVDLVTADGVSTRLRL